MVKELAPFALLFKNDSQLSHHDIRVNDLVQLSEATFKNTQP